MKQERGLYHKMIYLYIILCVIASAAIYTAIDSFFDFLSRKMKERSDRKRWKEVRELENRKPNIIIDTAELSEQGRS